MNLEEAIAFVLKQYRKKYNLSQEKLAHLCGLDRTFISLLERGKRKPTLNTIFILSEAFEIKASEIVQEVEKILDENFKQKSNPG
ncbi:helix-turn-helix domain-containing protein [Priestia megaterium]|uniref:helix-turn-helix domain-containing protein n=1 Tax=Priestia megaterium TaxID=1404 RepID=UPI0035CBF7F3